MGNEYNNKKFNYAKYTRAFLKATAEVNISPAQNPLEMKDAVWSTSKYSTINITGPTPPNR